MARVFRNILLMCGLVFWVAIGARAEESPLRELATGDESRGWEGVGRIDMSGTGFCTGALVAPDLVLTAAHCLFDDISGLPIDLSDVEFRAGWRNGRATAYRGVRRAVVHPDYDYKGADGMARVAHDLALLQLDREIRLPGLVPFATSGRPRKGQEVEVVSYAQDRSEAPSLQKVCHVLAGRPRILMLSCSVDFGSSGAPVFRVEEGEPRIVSVVSAKAEMANRKVALGVALGDQLELLRARLDAGEGVIGAEAAPMRRFGAGTARAQGGAKFLRP